MNEALADAIVESVHDIFLAFLSIEVFPGPSIEKPAFDPYEPPRTEVTALVGFSGFIRGGIHLSCPLHVALILAGTLAETPFDSMGEEASDAVGELANMIAGGLQTRFDDYGDICLTPPAVICGTHFGMRYDKNLASIKQYFKVDSGPFFVECFYIQDNP